MPAMINANNHLFTISLNRKKMLFVNLIYDKD